MHVQAIEQCVDHMPALMVYAHGPVIYAPDGVKPSPRSLKTLSPLAGMRGRRRWIAP